jgi:hypothetical protein
LHAISRKSNAALLLSSSETPFSVCNEPKESLEAVTRRVPFPFVLTISVLFFGLCLLTLASQFGNSFSEDSYGFAMLARSFQSGHPFAIDAVRDLYLPVEFPAPSRSFPPLYPALVALFGLFLNDSLYSGTLANLLILFATILLVTRLAKRLCPEAWLLVATAFLVFFFHSQQYQDEVAAARSIPLALLLWVSLFLLLAENWPDANRPLNKTLIGVGGGLLCLTRFDQLPAVLLTFLIFGVYIRVLTRTWRTALHASAFIALGFCLVYLPWAIRNAMTFGSFFASDNTLTVKSLYPGIAQLTWWNSGSPPLAQDAPIQWLLQRFGYFSRNLVRAAVETDGLLVLLPVFGLVFRRRFSQRDILLGSIVMGGAISTLFTTSLTPYRDFRYFSIVHFQLILLLLYGAARFWTEFFRPGLVHVLCAAALVLALASSRVLVTPEGTLPALSAALRSKTLFPHISDHEFGAALSQFKAKVPAISPQSLFAADNAEELSYNGRVRAIYFPMNITSAGPNLQSFVEHWKVDYLLLKQEKALALGFDERTWLDRYKDYVLISGRKI